MRSRWSAVFGLLLIFVLAACGAPPTVVESPEASGTEPTDGGPSGAPSGEPSSGENEALAALYAEIEGLTGDERRARLIELASEEEGELTVYTSTNLDESEPLVSAFEDATDIDVSLYRASASTVVQRVFQEAEANFEGGSDVIAINGPEMTVLDQQGLLAPLVSPATDNILEAGVFDSWAAMYLNVFVAAWNTDRMTADEAPTTYEELFTNYSGRLGMELGDWDWFATLVKSYFIEQQGMTEEEAVDLFKQAASGARVVDGHTLMTELLASGEFDITASNYQHRVVQLMGDGAPIEWQQPLQPIVVRPNGIGISASADNPAAALLYIEFVLTEGQDLFLELDRSPASTEALGALEGEYEVILADVEALLNEADKWEALYEEVVQESGGDVIED